MKIAIVALACVLGTFAAAETVEELGFDWDNIKSLDLFAEPIGPAPPQPGGLRVIGGTVAARGAFPYQAALIVNLLSFCGASIISGDWILTAAHCVDSALVVQVVVGAHNPRTTVDEPTQVRLTSNGRVIHSAWDRANLQNDIALLRVAGIPVGSPGISSISLAPATSGTFAGSTGTLTGWGRISDASNAVSNELRTVQLPILTNAVCQSSFGSIVTAQHICTSGAGTRGACNGDSGGPLVVSGVEVGVVSFGASQCEAGHPSVFARVSYFRNWISSNSGI